MRTPPWPRPEYLGNMRPFTLGTSRFFIPTADSSVSEAWPGRQAPGGGGVAVWMTPCFKGSGGFGDCLEGEFPLRTFGACAMVRRVIREAGKVGASWLMSPERGAGGGMMGLI